MPAFLLLNLALFSTLLCNIHSEQLNYMRKRGEPLIPIHYKLDTLGNWKDKEDKGEDLYLKFSEMV